METFKVWDEDEADARDVQEFRPAGAAEEWMRRRHPDLDYCSEHDVWVRAPDGTVTCWRVLFDTQPIFHAEPLPPVV